MSPVFKFKKFSINDDGCAMKINTDGVLLGAWVHINNVNRILDIGTGSGLIAMILAQRSSASIDAIDIHPPSIHMAIQNLANAPWPEQIMFEQVSLQDFSKQSKRKYDLIVSNPPYFESSLKSPDPDKNMAKHAEHLSSGDLIKGVNQLLTDKGRFCLILPSERLLSFKYEAESKGLFTQRITNVKGKTNKPANRVMIEFSKIAGTENVSEISIHDLKDKFTAHYKRLTADLYLHF